MARWQLVWAALFCVAGLTSAQEPRAIEAPVVLVGRLHCAPVTALANALGGQAALTKDGRSARLTVGPRTLDLRHGIVTAAGPEGLVLLPVPPFVRDGQLLAPSRAVVEHFGAELSTAGAAARVLRDSQVLATLPKGQEAPEPTTPSERVQQALNDPRVALDMQTAGLGLADTSRHVLDQFNTVANTGKPVLDGIANSKALRLARRVPIAGELLGLAQDVSGGLSEAVGLSGKLAQYDETKLAPVRRALEQTAALQAQFSADGARAAQPQWQAALPALDGQLADLDQLIKKLWMLSVGLKLVEAKMQAAQATIAGFDLSAGLRPLARATEQMLITARGMRWDRATLKDYFTRLSTAADQLR